MHPPLQVSLDSAQSLGLCSDYCPSSATCCGVQVALKLLDVDGEADEKKSDAVRKGGKDFGDS